MKKIKISKSKSLNINKKISFNVKSKKAPNLTSFQCLKKKRYNISSHNKFIHNPSITHFNLHSKFIFDIDEAKNFLNKNSNKKLLLVTSSEILKINEIIKEIQITKEVEKETDFIKISETAFMFLKNYIKIKELKDPLTTFIKEQFDTCDERDSLSCRKLSTLYFIRTGKKISRTTINNIIRKKLGYRYLKTMPKSSSINNNEHILISLTFIKIIVRSIILNYNILFCDETGLLNKNNNFRSWRKNDEEIYQKTDSFKRKNLIMTVSKDDVIYYEILNESTDTNTFLNYMKNLKKSIDKKGLKNYVIVMDNLSSHKSPALIEFYSKNNINIIFNSPKMSSFNSIELTFRKIKNILYKKLFSSIEDIQIKVSEIIQNMKSEKTLLFNYKETLCQYLRYIEKYRDFQFNDL